MTLTDICHAIFLIKKKPTRSGLYPVTFLVPTSTRGWVVRNLELFVTSNTNKKVHRRLWLRSFEK